MQVYEAILYYNNHEAIFKILPKWVNPIKGVVVDKIDEAQALAISTRVKPSAEAYDLPVSFVLACLAIESCFDPNCENGNLGPGESNTQNDPLGYDVGIAQLKLRYVLSPAHNIETADQARAFALDINRAVPYHCSIMAAKLLAATDVIQTNTSSVPDPRLSNPLLLATGMYNFGNTGMQTYYESGQFPSHCQQVLDLTNYFDKQLGNPNPVFSALT